MDQKISEMPAAITVAVGDALPIVQGGENKTATIEQVRGPAPVIPEQTDTVLMDIYNWTGSQAVADAAFLNYMGLTGIAKAAGGTIGTTLATGALTFPAVAGWAQVIFSIRLVGTVAGAAGTSREWAHQIRRVDGTTVVGSSSDVKVSGTNVGARDACLISYTKDATDPFTVAGTQLGLLNISGQEITLTSASVRIQRIINPA